MSEKVPLVGGPDSLPPWLRPQNNPEEALSEKIPLVGETTSPAERFIDNTDDTEEEDSSPEGNVKNYGYGYGYLSGGISPISSVSYTQPGKQAL